MSEEIKNYEAEEEGNVVVLTDPDGNDVEFEHLDTIEYNDEIYVILIELFFYLASLSARCGSSGSKSMPVQIQYLRPVRNNTS